MNKLILHHFYAESAFDLSNNRNHGHPTEVFKSPAPNAPSFDFTNPNSEVVVRNNSTLQNLWSIRALVTFNLSVALPISKRYNLMEGHLSFALFIEPNGVLTGTIVDKNGHWKGASSVSNTIKPNQWHTAELQHDGINAIRIILDGVEVAAAYNVLGPVVSVGSHGIAIGHWPEQPGTYTFMGFIRETFLYKFDPYKQINGLLDSCCTDKHALQNVVNTLKQKGETSESLEKKGWEILQFAVDSQAEVRGNDKATTVQQQKLGEAALAAFMRGDQTAYDQAMVQLALMSQINLTATQQENLRNQEEKIVAGLPLPLKDFQKLIGDLCLDKVKLDPKQLAAKLEHLKKIKN
jgi:hypothetical protein